MKYNYFKKKNLKYWVLLFVFVLMLISTSILLMNSLKKTQYKEHYRHLQSDMVFIVKHIKQHLQSGDYYGVDFFLKDWFFHIERIIEIKLTGKNGFVLCQFKRDPILSRSLSLNRKISYSYHGLATLEIVANYDEVDKNIKHIFHILLLIIFLASLALGFITWLALKKRLLASNLVKNEKELKERAKNAEKQNIILLEQENKIRSIFSSAPIGIGLVINRKIMQVNDHFCEMTGYTADELIDQNARILYKTQEDYDLVGKIKYEQIKKNGTGSVETCFRRKNGKIIDVILSSTPIDPVDLSRGVTFSAMDITERLHAEKEKNKLEEQLRQAQKMEAIGTLAGGIAHDFNNILGVIMGYTELTMDAVSENKVLMSNLKRIMSASERAKDMVQQILSFSRKSETSMKPVYIKKIIMETVKFLRASIPTTIGIELDIDEGLEQVIANGTQINQVLMNLCTNAGHAMKNDGGQLWISLNKAEVSLENPIDDLKPGKYQILQVKDSGTGIKKDVLEKIFEPYFTTKKVGEGTGMGLAVAYGIVKSHNGHINVYTETGVGTVFNVYLPLIKAEQEVKTEKVVSSVMHGNGERILFVDDEEDLVDLGANVLEKLGYSVEAKNSSLEAFESFKTAPDKYDLLITDKTMPGLTGFKLAKKIHKIRPDLPIILCTGFSNGLEEGRYKSAGINALVMKPISVKNIATVVRNVLDRKN